MNRGEIERSLRQQYARKQGDNVINMNAYRCAKIRMKALREEKKILDSIRQLTQVTHAQVNCLNDWAEMDRIFNDLYEMGCIPQVRVNYHA